MGIILPSIAYSEEPIKENARCFGLCTTNETFDPSEPESAKASCFGAFKNKKPSQKELEGVLAQHLKWVSEKAKDQKWIDYVEKTGEDTRRAHLCGADLSGLNFQQTELSGADLSGANLSKADFFNAKLAGAIMFWTNLAGSNMNLADLEESGLIWANLSRANLNGAKLKDAIFYNADVTGTLFAFEDKSPPDTNTLAFARNLEQLNFIPQNTYGFPDMMILRESFKKGGFRYQERVMTFLIKQAQEKINTSCVETIFHHIAFNLTSEYGKSPSRCLWIMFYLTISMSLLYFIALYRNNGGGLWAVWSNDRTIKQEGTDQPIRLSFAMPFPPSSHIPSENAFELGAVSIKRWLFLCFVSYCSAFYFSLLSAFHFGWRDLNVSNWIARIQPREYAIRPTGWVRVVSGIQSLISLYLVALWVLTYFGRPFD